MFCLFQLLSAMLGKMDKDDGPLPQDLTEGCDDDEWVRYRILTKKNCNFFILSFVRSETRLNS